ncbi:hypothetical protein B5S28_g2117 [[Candida] boidinii]|uniref:Unnamed protein product n=1 Tax=Candida boidinii TaxID=5477 RepID=A0ACB5THC6_CANBO|nr:hypothetical protein B5S28_g2117 [[Candida] boidinii]OWB63844.1 hypothetical protein B5S29_g4857 [[Candida] boidinii]OWB75000.1 hypothetical protein B5S31_g4844 [[Candida] boidinii]OWB79417.1 hypothetical protein B5S32_g3639 [[Candida] boidinii]GME88276.1 unnamed protein product [[Candida] boidinii]
MVSKLSFKGDKKNKKKKSKKHRIDEDEAEHEHDEGNKRVHADNSANKSGNGESQVMIRVNNESVPFNSIDKEEFETGWTVCTDVSELTNGPIVICFEREDEISKDGGKYLGILNYDTKDRESSLQTSGKNKFDILKDSLTINKNEYDIIDCHNDLIKIEPNSKDQLFLPISIDKLISDNLSDGDNITDKSIKRVIIKNDQGYYLSYDRDSGDSCLKFDSKVVTVNQIFNFRINYRKRNDDGDESEFNGKEGYYFNISVGDIKNKDKLIIIGNKIKVIKDQDDLLNDLNEYLIKIKTINCNSYNKFKRELKEINDNKDMIFDNSKDNELLNDKIKELINDGYKINNKILKDLKNSIKIGNLNEFLVEFKAKNKSDSMC